MNEIFGLQRISISIWYGLKAHKRNRMQFYAQKIILPKSLCLVHPRTSARLWQKYALLIWSKARMRLFFANFRPRNIHSPHISASFYITRLQFITDIFEHFFPLTGHFIFSSCPKCQMYDSSSILVLQKGLQHIFYQLEINFKFLENITRCECQ